jgi:hypothetical protein
MIAIPIEESSGSEESTFFPLIGRIIGTLTDKTTAFGIGTGDDISSSAPSHGWELSED